MNRRRRAACGRPFHGLPSTIPDETPTCYGYGRPGSHDGSNEGWRHVGSGPFRSELGAWAASVGAGWVHVRDLVKAPLVYGECLCRRPDCAALVYINFMTKRQKEEKGSLAVMATGQSSPTGRYPSLKSQVQGLLAFTDVQGRVLDCCGARGDAVSAVLTGHGLHVTTNDFDRRLLADTHMDVASDVFREYYDGETRRPGWIITSPPYNGALTIVKQA